MATAVVGFVALLAYVAWLWPVLDVYAGGSDSAGYLLSAQLFRRGRLEVPITYPPAVPGGLVNKRAFMPIGSTVRHGVTLVPAYPTGFPLHVAALDIWLDHEDAVRAVEVLTVVVNLLLAYRIGRLAGLHRHMALGAAALLALSPLFLTSAVQPLSDALATAWAQAAVYFGWRARARDGYAVLAGVSVGIAALVRPTAALMVVPVLCALPVGLGSYLRLAVGALPAAAFLLAYQDWAFGSPFASGYGRVWWLFSWGSLAPTLRHYATWIPPLVSWVVLASPLVVGACRGEIGRWRLVIGAWVLAVFGTYAFYGHTSETWWYLRFVLPGVPALVVAAVAGVQFLAAKMNLGLRRLGLAAAPSAIVACVAIVLAGAGLVRHPLFTFHRYIAHDEVVYRDSLAWMVDRIPGKSVVLMMQLSGACMLYQPDVRFVRWDWLNEGDWTVVRDSQHAMAKPVYALLFPFEQDRLFPHSGPTLPCAWHFVGAHRQVALWECPTP